ncbi:fungal specific transcription factor domain-containing protein [Aspergillus chevalieri]|uniref:Uncharacterized protein n=1 Tax=Aspergillus chevalieri TaxID=182096 RepID=A0A7R7VVD2_ASPCH|nr:uncharacterized protein ACHE_70173A [Aspergillus chevalieri]BCR91330.1 hypothetical protein ACHE_70173A [Aspergillus chevalieri]
MEWITAGRILSWTEFYGNSSNLAFLGNLYARARKHRAPHVSGDGYFYGDFQSTAGPSQAYAEDRNKDSTKATDRTQLSIVNLLYNPSYPSNSSSQSPWESEKDKDKTVQTDNPETPSNNIILGSGIAPVNQLANESQLEIEKTFISSYFSNKHYIHPMLCKSSFLRRCEREAFNLSRRKSFACGSSNFAGLYFAVVALGAINASPDETSLLDHYCTYSPDPRRPGTGSVGGYSALDFANFYFGAAKRALGDVSESCSLESAQALMLLVCLRLWWFVGLC